MILGGSNRKKEPGDFGMPDALDDLFRALGLPGQSQIPCCGGSFGWGSLQEKLMTTPWKINMEPTNHPFRKENDLPNLHYYVPC